MTKIILSILICMCCSVSYSATKVGTFGVPNSDGVAPMEVYEDRSISVTGNIGIGTATPLSQVDIRRTSSWTYVTDAPLRSSWVYSVGSSDVAPAVYGYSKNTGSNANSGGHFMGVLGIAQDNVDNKLSVYGVEGRVNWHTANAVTSAGVIGLAHWYDSTVGNTTTFNSASTNVGILTLAEILNNDETTPRYEGFNMGLFVNNNVGGFLNYGIKVNTQTGGLINIGTAIGYANYRTLQVNDTTDSTDTKGGITFGVSGDTTLYRSAVGTLKTSGALNVDGAIYGQIPVISGSTVCWNNTGKFFYVKTSCP